MLERRRQELKADPPRPVDISGLPPARSFREALVQERLAVIGEVKRRSPSKGDLDASLDLGALVRRYEQGGARACSVLTDSDFSGSLADLEKAREACDLPLLRKDFL